jgi:hypothetical protein
MASVASCSLQAVNLIFKLLSVEKFSLVQEIFTGQGRLVVVVYPKN